MLPPTPRLLAFATSLLFLVGCGSSSLTPQGRSSLSSVETTLVPTAGDDSPALVPLWSGGFVGAVLSDEGELTLRRFSDDLAPMWSTVVSGEAGPTRFGVGSELHGTNGFTLPDPQERILALVGSGERILMLSYRCDEGERPDAIGRIFDAARGSLLDSRVVFTVPFDYSDDAVDPDLSDLEIEERRRCHVAFSADSSRMVVYAFPARAEGPDIAYAVVDASLSVLRAGTAVREQHARPEATTIAIDNRGDVHILCVESAASGRGFQLETSRSDGASTVASTPLIADVEFGSPRLVLDPTPIAFSAISRKGSLVGIAVGRFDPSAREASLSRVDVSEDVFEKELDNDVLASAWLHPVIVTPGPTRYVLLLERRSIGSRYVTRNGTSGSVGYSSVGDALIAGLDASATARWFTGIEKDITFENYRHGFHQHFGGLRTHVTTDGILHVLYRDWFTIGVRRINPADGSSEARENDGIVEASAMAIPLTTTATWLNDRRLVMLSKSGLMATTVVLNRIDY